MRRKSSPGPVDEEEAAREKCLRLLRVRGRSAAELRERLRSTGFSGKVIEKVVPELAAVGLVDDAEFARSWVASRQAAGGAGRRKLRWELRRKGVAEELITRAVEQAASDEAELAQALSLARRRLKEGRQDRKSLARLRRLLLGRGFEFDTVDAVMQQIISEGEH
jgi:regulatory protein